MQTIQYKTRVQKDNSTKTTFGNKILGYANDYFL